jgi:hypothetical protein
MKKVTRGFAPLLVLLSLLAVAPGATAAPSTAAAQSTVLSAPTSTPGQRNALKSAKAYIRSGAFSKSGLIEQLEYEDYSNADARWAVARVGASWNAEAVESAKAYLKSGSFSRQALIEQLEYEGFTSAQAKYGVKKAYK